jgi:hypothetical protein
LRVFHRPTIQPYARWDEFGPTVRRNERLIMDLLAKPCSGTRLRDPPSGATSPPTASGRVYRWSEFCKIDLPNRWRVIYRWMARPEVIRIELIGQHYGSGRLGDVYDALQELYDLPDSHGHDQLVVERCCEPMALPPGGCSEAEARRIILRQARR